MKRIILVVIGILGVFVVVLLFEREENDNIYLTNKEIKNSNSIAVMIEQEDGQYQEKEDIPQSGYILNTEKSKCSNGAIPTWNNNKLKLSKLTSDNTSCYLYFEIEPSKKTLTALGREAQEGIKGGFTGVDNQEHLDSKNQYSVLFSDEDDYGITYYFRGKVNDNWVKFGQTNDGQDIWWRIIRINGNGTIRLIYAGTSDSAAPSTTGATTQIDTSAYNAYYNDNKYVGYMFGTASSGTEKSENEEGTTDASREVLNKKSAHTNNYDSTIKDVLDKWYDTTNLGTTGKVDKETGFCNDREPVATDHGSYGKKTYGKNTAGYAPADRVWGSGSSTSWDTTRQEPTLKCGTDESKKYDLFTGENAEGVMVDGKKIEGNKKLKNPVGLIIMDEVIYAGGFAEKVNDKYWLYTNQIYWTMSPYIFNNTLAYMFAVNSNGNLSIGNVQGQGSGVRPVINLKADVKLTGTGIITDPYRLEGVD